ncbi:DUF2024 family protein [Tenacibaculum salmonis]|uniref:DUF2024 family protein n=1 Tax=Tenacibaculum sp. P3-BQ1 TaxID=3232310 RepID=UPI0034DE93E6
MEIAVWDTYVKRKDGKTMHFDILVPNALTDKEIIFGYGKSYLKTKTFETLQLTSNECKLCHMEEAPEAIIEDIEEEGYYIIEMENCN